MKAVGGGYLSLVPRYLIVSPKNETDAELLIANASRPTATEKATSEWISSLELVVEPRLLDTTPWPIYLAADSAQIDTCELGLLEESLKGPYIETQQGFERDESRWKIRHTAGAKLLDWRGIVKIPTA